MSSVLDGSGIYAELAPALELVVASEEVFNVSMIQQELLQIGIDSGTIKILANSFINANRVSVVAQRLEHRLDNLKIGGHEFESCRTLGYFYLFLSSNNVR